MPNLLHTNRIKVVRVFTAIRRAPM